MRRRHLRPLLAALALVASAVAVFPAAAQPTDWPTQPLLDKLNAAVNATLAAPDVRKRFAAYGGEPVGTTPEDFSRVIRRDIERYTTLIKEAGIRVD